MRVRIYKIGSTSRPTYPGRPQPGEAVPVVPMTERGDSTVPIVTGRAAAPSCPTVILAAEGRAVRFLSWDGGGRPVFTMAESPFEAVDYDLPMVVVLDAGEVWHSSRVQMMRVDEQDRPVRVETAHSIYRIEWVETSG